jgi:hypothetical protein
MQHEDILDTAPINKPINIVVCITTYMTAWTPAVESWIRACIAGDRYLREHGGGKISGVGLTQRTYVHASDNQLAADFLTDPTATHMLHLESDMIIPDWTIEKLLEVQQPIVSGTYFLRNGRGAPCLYKRAVSLKKGNPYAQSPITLFPQDRPFELKGGCAGLGCLLIAREVFEQIERPWFQLKDGEAGFSLWVQPAVMCGQIDYTVVGVEDYQRRLAEDPGFAASGFIVGTHEGP